VIVTVTPNPSLDLTYQLPAGTSLAGPDVEVHRALSVSLEASGKGVNVSRALTLAGRPSTAVLFAGGRTGRQLVELLEADRVPHRAVPQAGPTRVNTTLLTPGGPTVKVNAPGSGISATELDNLVIAVDNEMVTLSSEAGRSPGPDWLLICGSLPPDTDAAALIGRLVERAHARGWRVAVDSSGAGLAAAVKAGADLLAPNAAELDTVLEASRGEVDWNVDADLFTAATAVAAQSGCELLVSLGADGALWTDGRRTLHARGPAVVPVNSAGAGDALLAGWFSADGLEPEDRLATAVAWGTAACLVATTVAPATSGASAPATDSVLVSDVLAGKP
jgi:1-phosphofructokinase